MLGSVTLDQDQVDRGSSTVGRRGPPARVAQASLIDYQSNKVLKYNGVGHIAINCPTKRTLVFREDLNGWIEKDEDDFQEDIVQRKKEIVKKFKESPLSKPMKKA
ncbi:hypothetical protein M9H77_08016 [Catharanthus roseus]|uniref:Uncharacterized protein n=1 Tax=Catharanthus roseus TaxID=4058 RepID=A0ACC0BWX8_CATRO|nr:hypothetical protein M9H77_08016 [Catharanthus roseus]